ncbi:MAG: hypothetical protein WD823_08675 [Sulfuricaulis sp.]|uniref:hypothetical protein n=1 Tax=Sulfuricaulis sp. TaxID=2003553 RepID=UPI0034A47C67
MIEFLILIAVVFVGVFIYEKLTSKDVRSSMPIFGPPRQSDETWKQYLLGPRSQSAIEAERKAKQKKE